MSELISLLGMNIRIGGKLLRTACLDAEKYHFVKDPETVVSAIKKLQARIDVFTFIEPLTGGRSTYSYPMEMDNFAALPISTYDHWWSEQIGFKARNKAKQATKKGVLTREVPFNKALVQGIWEIYNECPVRQGKPFKHFGKTVETVYKESATYLDSSVFIGAFFDEKLIGFAKLVSDQDNTQAGLMNIVSMIKHRDKAPSNTIISEAVRSCANRSIGYLVYSNFAYGHKEKDSLAEFKERNGFLKMDVPRYHVPLTPLGSAAIRLGLHKGIVHRVPEGMLVKLRTVRNSWYEHRMQAVKMP